MNQILDEIDKNEVPQKTFSKLAFGTAITSTILVIYYMSQIPSEMKASDIGKPFISPIFPIIMFTTCFSGFFFSIISIAKKRNIKRNKMDSCVNKYSPFINSDFGQFL